MPSTFRILLIDDNPDDRLLVERSLEREFKKISTEHITGPRDLERALSTFDYDLVITDFQLNWTDGLKVLEKIKACAPNCPTIMFTGTGDEHTAVAAMKAGLDDYVVKSSAHFERLIIAIHFALERQQQRQAVQETETRYRDLVEHVPVGLYRVTTKGQIIEANSALAQILGFDRADELLSINFQSLCIHREHHDEWLKQIKSKGLVIDFEAPVRHRNGSTLWIKNSARAITNETGEQRYFEGVIEDISARKQAEEALRASETRLRAILEAQPECVELIGPKGELLQINPAGLEMMEADSFAQIAQRPIFDLVVPEHHKIYHAFIEHVLREHSGLLEFEIIGLKGTRRWLETHATLLVNKDGTSSILGITRDITKHKQSQERLNYLAHFDSLTGLPNRALFNDRLAQAIFEAKRHNRVMSVMFLDLDRFKNVNDSLGHEAGDQLIKAAAERLTGAVRQGDTVARLSGDEFTVVLTDMAHADDAARVAKKILEVFVPSFRILDRELHITTSIGITLFPVDGTDVPTLLRNADVAMYRAKDTGRNSYQFYSTDMTLRATEYLALENDLRHAVERAELVLHYQPVLNCQTNRIIAVEALLRWNHPDRGLVQPDDFIPLAEETGLIIPIGEWVIHEASQQCHYWRQNSHPDLRVAVNLSARQFQMPGLDKTIARALQTIGLPPIAFELELTESVTVHHSEETLRIMRALSDLGVTFTIDDFGTGYSSLSYLKRLPIDTLKVDRSFVRDIPEDSDDVAITEAIITLAHTLDMKVIAEGVETAEQLTFLRAHKCDAIQGYYISRPVPPSELTEMLHIDQKNGS